MSIKEKYIRTIQQLTMEIMSNGRWLFYYAENYYFSQDFNLVSHTTNVVCGKENFSWQFYFTLRIFVINLLIEIYFDIFFVGHVWVEV